MATQEKTKDTTLAQGCSSARAAVAALSTAGQPMPLGSSRDGAAVAAPARLPKKDGSPVAGTHGAASAAGAASEA